MTNLQTIRSFLQDPSGSYSNPRETLYSAHGVLFSYGPHYPLAVVQHGHLYLNGDRYSATTSKQRSQVVKVAIELGLPIIGTTRADICKGLPA